MEVKNWSYEDFPEYQTKLEDAEVLDTTGDEVFVSYHPDVPYSVNPDDLTDRETYMTDIGPVCMSRYEQEQYLEKLEEFPPSVEFLWDASAEVYFRWSILWNVMTCITDRLLESAGYSRGQSV